MSISRKNWSALSSLARQWTMEDEEEVEREKRRKEKSSTGGAEEADAPGARLPASGPAPGGTGSTPETSHDRTSAEQIQLDFVEMLRLRDEKRRRRHVEALRRQKEVEEDGGGGGGGEEGEGGARVEILGDASDEPAAVFYPSGPEPPAGPANSSSSSRRSSSSSNRQNENGEKEPAPKSSSTRKFVSSVSISLDQSPSTSGRSTPRSPCSPTPPWSPRERGPSPCHSPSPAQDTHTQKTGSECDQTNRRPFVRQSSRTLSFRMMRKTEEGSAPLQRSASVRVATKMFECSTDQNQDEDKASPFMRNSRQRISSRSVQETMERLVHAAQDQNEDEDKPSSFFRNARQRVSSRSIQEKMERLAQAAQKSEITRSPDVTQRTLALLEEVTRKKGLFEKEQQEAAPGSSSAFSKQDLRHVDINTKRSLFENRGDNQFSSAGKSYK